MFNGRRVRYNAHNLSAATAWNLISLECIHPNRITTRVPTHVPTSGVQSVPRRHTSLYIPCMQLIFLNPSALGLWLMENVLLVLDPNALNSLLGLITLFVDLPGLICKGLY